MLQVKRSGRSNSKLGMDALLGALGAMALSQMAPWGVNENGGFANSTFVGMAAGAIAGWVLPTVTLAVVDGAILFVYFVVAFTPVMNAVTSRWVRSDAMPAAQIEAVVVLSSGIRPDSSMSADGADRLLSGLELLKSTNAPRLVVTRGSNTVRGREVVADADQQRFAQLAGVASRMTIVGPVAVTHDEATRTATLLGGASGHRIAVVTSPMHTRRACAIFEHAGFRVTCVAAREREFVTRDPVTPQDRLAAMRYWTYEVAGTVKSRFHGWM